MAALDLAPGVLLGGKYRLERLLGTGGMGVVWAAEHLVSGEKAALKFIKEQTNDPGARRRFLREIRAAAAVRHPNVVRIVEVIELDDGSPVMVMELLAGESFGARLRRERRVPLPDLAEIMVPVLSAVGVAHGLGVVHRDLKPENIFLTLGADGERVVKVLDFGIAKLTALDGEAAMTTRGTTGVVGTPEYMAPEQVYADPHIDHRADVWALGIILYQGLSGVLPTGGGNVGQIFKKVTHGPFEPLQHLVPDIPPQVSKLVARMLSRERNARPADLREVMQVLETYASAPALGFGPPTERAPASANPLALLQGSREAPFHVPFLRNENFVGRDADLERLHATLREYRTAGVRPAMLTGMGGIGKTQLAVEYAYRFRGEYPGGVYWVNAAQGWAAELAALAEKAGLPDGGGAESGRQERYARAFVAYLGGCTGALVIFDNVEEPLALREPVFGIIPAQLACRLLFTTRRRDQDSPFETVDVRVLPEDTAVALLLGSKARRGLLVGGPSGELEAARAICQALGCLPLAVVLAAAYLGKYPRILASGYLQRLRREGAAAAVDAGKVDPRALATLHKEGVEATLQAQWEAVGSEDARQVLQTTALLGEAAQVRRATLALLTGLGDKATMKPGYPAPLEEALIELAGLSLVETLTEEEIRLHPLVREFAEKQIAERAAFAATCGRRMGEALRDMRRLHEEVAGRGVDAVLGDLRVGVGIAGVEARAGLERLVRPLDQEAHCLRRWDAARDPGFLLQQVRNRCFEMGIGEVQGLAAKELEKRGWGWLRERVRMGRESEALVRMLEGHIEAVNGVAVTSDGLFAISASRDKTLKVWDLATGQAVRTLEEPTGSVIDVAVSLDGRFAVSTSKDQLKVRNLATGRTVCTLEGHTGRVSGVAVTSDSCFAVSASWDKTLKVWELETGQAVRTLEGHTNKLSGVAVTLDGRFAISASEDKTLKVWDIRTGQTVHTLEGHTGRVNGVAVTPDGSFAVSASWDKTLKVWDLATGHAVRSLEGHTDEVNSVAVTSDGRFAVSASDDNTLRAWDLATGQAVHTFEGHTSPVLSTALTSDGNFVVSASEDKTLRVWQFTTGQDAGALGGHTSRVNGVAVTPDGRFAVSASYDETLKVWDLATGQTTRTLEGHTNNVNSVAVTPDGSFAVSASWDKTLKVWDLATGQTTRTLEGHALLINSVALTADGRFAVSASQDEALKVWDLATGQAIRTLDGHISYVLGVAVTSDGRFAVSASHDETLKVWDIATGQAVHTLQGHTASVRGVAVTPNGDFVVSASDDKTVKVWDLATGRVVRTLEGHTDLVNDVAVTSDGRFAISASDDKTLKLWNLSTGLIVVTLEIHSPLRCCAVSPDGCTFVASDVAGALHILDLLPSLPA